MRATEEGLTNVEFIRADAQVHPFAAASFDLVVSRFGVMFFADPAAAFANLHRATAPGGRFAALVWQPLADNEWLRTLREAVALGGTLPDPGACTPGPFGLSDPAHTRGVMETAGFTRVEHADVDVPFWFGDDADEAVAFGREIGLIRAVLEQLDDDDTARALDALRVAMVEHESADGVVFDSRAWVVTAFR
jgi:SAM-dependent methyltransferase